MSILVTGASGVVGTAVLRELAGHDVIAGAHHRLPTGSAPVIRLDLTAPLLGLAPREYEQLCEQVDTVVHSAAIVNFSAYQSEVDRVNIEGLGRTIELAAEADALFIQVSTAYVSRYGRSGGGDRIGTTKNMARTDEYVVSKYLGEQMVRDSGIDALIVRPSVVIGDSRTGEIRTPQAVHTLAEHLLKGMLPFIPAQPGSVIDLIPQDLMAQGIRALIDARVRSGEFWLTAGQAALPVERFLELVIQEGKAAGLDPPPSRLADPGIVDRLVRPAFADVVPPDDLARLDSAVAVCGLVIITDRLDSSFGAIPGGPATLTAAEVEEAWRLSLRKLIRDLEVAQ
jgi:nucleoside-diphosphate-sugar epimerase